MSDVSEENVDKINNTEETEDGENDDVTVEGEEGEEEEQEKEVHLHTRQIPTIVMLSGGAAAAIFTFIRHDPLLTSLEIIFVALVIFLILGDLIKILLDGIIIEKRETKDENKDKVIERSKDPDASGSEGEEYGNAGENAESPEQIET